MRLVIRSVAVLGAVALVGLRVSSSEERQGLDIALHGELLRP